MKWLIMIMFGFTFFITIGFFLSWNMTRKDVKNNIFGKIIGLENIFDNLQNCALILDVNKNIVNIDSLSIKSYII